MRLIIAGSRGFADYPAMSAWLVDIQPHVTEVVSGTARGADDLGERWAKIRGIPVKPFPADWAAHGKAAGHIRNRAMAKYADAAVVFWDGQSRGTANMVAEAKAAGIPCFIVRFES